MAKSNTPRHEVRFYLDPATDTALQDITKVLNDRGLKCGPSEVVRHALAMTAKRYRTDLIAL